MSTAESKPDPAVVALLTKIKEIDSKISHYKTLTEHTNRRSGVCGKFTDADSFLKAFVE